MLIQDQQIEVKRKVSRIAIVILLDRLVTVSNNPMKNVVVEQVKKYSPFKILIIDFKSHRDKHGYCQYYQKKDQG